VSKPSDGNQENTKNLPLSTAKNSQANAKDYARKVANTKPERNTLRYEGFKAEHLELVHKEISVQQAEFQPSQASACCNEASSEHSARREGSPHDASNNRHPKAGGKKRNSPEAAGIASDPQFAQRMREKEEDHRRRLRQMEEEMEREQRELLKEMEREQAEHSARRRAQAEWKEELAHETQRRMQEARRAACERDGMQAQADETWRNSWWRNWHRSQECAQQKVEEQKKWSKQWWEQFQEKPEDEEYEEWQSEEEPAWPPPERSARQSSGTARSRLPPAPPPPPPKGAACAKSFEQIQVLEQLVLYRREPLEERKRTWRQMCFQWHPDKCGDKSGATAMFQFLQSLKEWFLAEK
jgi:hypothetical protein